MGDKQKWRMKMNQTMTITKRETIEAALAGAVLFAFLAIITLAGQQLGV